MHERYGRAIGLLTLGLSIYLACGFVQWVLFCTANGYFRQGLKTLAAFELVNQLNRYALMFAACVVGTAIMILLSRKARPWLARVLLNAEVADTRPVSVLLTSFNLLIFFTGIAIVVGIEASTPFVSTTPRSFSDLLRGILALFSSSSSLTAAYRLLLTCGGIAILFFCGAAAMLSHCRCRPFTKGTRRWVQSRWICLFGILELLFLAALNGWSWRGAGGEGRRNPNVILISVDTLRPDHLETYGGLRKTAPHIAGLSARGFVFSNAYAQAPWTLPSLASLHTGLYPYLHGAEAFNRAMRVEETTLAEAMKDNSYFTVGVTSAWFASRVYGFAQGFDIFDQSQVSGSDSVTSRRVTEAAVRYLKQNSGRKFFLWVHYYDPHSDYMRHPEYAYADWYTGLLPSALGPSYLDHIRNRLGTEDQRYLLDVYDEEITFTDAAIGQLLQALGEMKLVDNTIIVLTADHGEEFMDHNGIGHGKNLYDETIRVPLVIAGATPPIHRQLDLNTPVETRSLGRTILNMCGAYSTPFPGTDLLAQGQGSQNRPLAFSQRSSYQGKATNEAVISAGWKLIHNLVADSYELYDLRQDRHEKLNLFPGSNEAQQNAGAALAGQLKGFGIGASKSARPAKLTEEELKRLRSLGYLK
jgi:arylsulfatase A-like enzyme